MKKITCFITVFIVIILNNYSFGQIEIDQDEYNKQKKKVDRFIDYHMKRQQNEDETPSSSSNYSNEYSNQDEDETSSSNSSSSSSSNRSSSSSNSGSSSSSGRSSYSFGKSISMYKIDPSTYNINTSSYKTSSYKRKIALSDEYVREEEKEYTKRKLEVKNEKNELVHEFEDYLDEINKKDNLYTEHKVNNNTNLNNRKRDLGYTQNLINNKNKQHEQANIGKSVAMTAYNYSEKYVVSAVLDKTGKALINSASNSKVSKRVAEPLYNFAKKEMIKNIPDNSIKNYINEAKNGLYNFAGIRAKSAEDAETYYKETSDLKTDFFGLLEEMSDDIIDGNISEEKMNIYYNEMTQMFKNYGNRILKQAVNL